MELIGEWKDFESELDARILEGINLVDVKIENQTDLESKFVEYKNWKQGCLDFLRANLKDDPFYSESFRLGTHGSFFVPGQDYSWEKKATDYKQKVKSDISNLKLFRKLLSVSDAIVAVEKIDLKVRRSYSTKEILCLLIDKLYDLYDDNLYPILPILIGNGIELKRQREEFELLELLESDGLVESRGVTTIAEGQLTIRGKIYIETRRSIEAKGYDSIPDNQDELRGLITNLETKIRDLGLGQEIIFEELQELKFAVGKISKKNIGQLLKVKLQDWAFLQVISDDNAKALFEFVVGEANRLLGN